MGSLHPRWISARIILAGAMECSGPPPARNAAEIYGLSTNNKEQQAEADRSTVLAASTTQLAQKPL